MPEPPKKSSKNPTPIVSAQYFFLAHSIFQFSWFDHFALRFTIELLFYVFTKSICDWLRISNAIFLQVQMINVRNQILSVIRPSAKLLRPLKRKSRSWKLTTKNLMMGEHEFILSIASTSIANNFHQIFSFLDRQKVYEAKIQALENKRKTRIAACDSTTTYVESDSEKLKRKRRWNYC